MSANPSPQPGVSVRVEGLCKTYQGEPVLKEISFTVHGGEIFVLMGASGSGKTVLLKHLIGLETPDEGAVFVDDKPLEQGPSFELTQAAMVFQSGGLLQSLNVEQNVGLFLKEHRRAVPSEIRRIVQEKLQLVGLLGYENKMVSQLSGGMRKRVAIARALTMDPRLILYDEPTSELDPETAVRIGKEILNLNRTSGVTSIIVSHDRDLAFGIADRIAVLHLGQLICSGTPEEIQSNTHSSVRKLLDARYRRDFPP